VGNAILAFDNKADTATISGGLYYPTLPLSNLKTRPLAQVARTQDLALTSTQFLVDIGAHQDVRMVGVASHNLSDTAKYRIRGGNDPTFATYSYNSGWKNVWAIAFPALGVSWTAQNWFTGRYTDKQKVGLQWNIREFMSSLVDYRYWLFEFDDQARIDGVPYVQFGRLMIMTAYQPVVNMSPDAEVGWVNRTESQETISGALYFQKRTPYRYATFSADWMLDDEAFASAFDLERLAGIDNEVFFAFDPNDTLHAIRRSWLGTLVKPNPIKIKNYLLRTKVWEVRESL
jgi:hypothetical protein